MYITAQKDHFSRSFVRAVAAAAGVGADVPELDQNSCDIAFAAPDTKDAPGPRLDAQLKCTSGVDLSGSEFSYALPVSDYNHLRWTEGLYVPRILIVVVVPDDPTDWFTAASPETVTLRRCAYWASLKGAPSTHNTSTVNVKIPTNQVFDVSALRTNLAPPGDAL
jgi:Domain of unknown function (DUF4365)